ncbi:MAG: tetratricopeptide repeat protein [Tepidisphaeraceae bacterium]
MTREKLRQLRARIRTVEGRSPAYAILLAQRYLHADPSHVLTRLLLGRLLTELARYDEAERELRRALKECPRDHRSIALSQLGHSLRAQHRDEEAIEAYRHAVETDPVNTGAHVFLGALLAKLGRLDEAEATCRNALEQCYEGELSEVWLNLGFVLRAKGRFIDAASAFREALVLDPNYREAKTALRDVERCVAYRIKSRKR